MSPGAAPGPKKDSVELLLDGMPNVQPQPPRTTPQTAGQSSAAYHAEHSVRPAHTSPDDVPKVVVERPPQHQTVRLDRSKLQAVIEQAQAIKAQRQQPAADAGMPLSLRIAIAVVAGLAVVLGIFLFLTRASQSNEAAAAAPAVAPAPPAVLPAPPATDTTVATSPTVPQVPTAADTQPPSVGTSAATPPSAASPPPVSTGAAPRPKPRSSAPAGSGAGLGEFKTTFH